MSYQDQQAVKKVYHDVDSRFCQAYSNSAFPAIAICFMVASIVAIYVTKFAHSENFMALVNIKDGNLTWFAISRVSAYNAVVGAVLALINLVEVVMLSFFFVHFSPSRLDVPYLKQFVLLKGVWQVDPAQQFAACYWTPSVGYSLKVFITIHSVLVALCAVLTLDALLLRRKLFKRARRLLTAMDISDEPSGCCGTLPDEADGKFTTAANGRAHAVDVWNWEVLVSLERDIESLAQHGSLATPDLAHQNTRAAQGLDGARHRTNATNGTHGTHGTGGADFGAGGISGTNEPDGAHGSDVLSSHAPFLPPIP
eukprot:CAMPEP_0175128176 /NCGR_PEP_ID=MMETSP0087-20121206/4789_1 /TAXON_ID=136419 /ORGANISM="Unknown Unknown, Strain D1" /LENGTH=310 /DNA_ID=CAMNT_0016410221 /DNA_START=134 /DNA_END=1066 /DNA_ORIENTATION=-